MPYLLPYQQRWLDDRSSLKICEKSRQIGMTLADACDSVCKASMGRARHDVWISSRDEMQAKLYLEDCAKWARILNLFLAPIRQEVIDKKSGASAYVLQFKNGRRIYSLSSNPNALAGKRGHVKLDEFALHEDQRTLYQVAKPVTQWGGSLSILSTHRGANTVFNKILREIKEGRDTMGWSLHSVPLQEAAAQGLVERINQKTGASETRDDFIARLRRQCLDEDQWLQEYCCVPSQNADSFISFEMITACIDPALRLVATEELFTQYATRNTNAGFPQESINPSIHQSSLFVGIDVARKHDLCVIDVGEKIGDVMWDRARIELQGAPFAQIESELFRLLRLREVKRACIDASGLGAQLAERAQLKFGWKVEPITFTAPIKEELAFGLRSDFEEQRLRIVADDALSADLRGVRKLVTSSGNIRFDGHSEDSHCDRFWAKALRQHAARLMPQIRAVVG